MQKATQSRDGDAQKATGDPGRSRGRQVFVPTGHIAQLAAAVNKSPQVRALAQLGEEIQCSSRPKNQPSMEPGAEAVQLIVAGTLAHSDRVEVESDHVAQSGSHSRSSEGTSSDCGSKSEAGCGSTPKAPEERHRDLKSPAPATVHQRKSQTGIVQCVTLKEMFDHYQADKDQLGSFASWLTARAGNNDNDRDYLLHVMSKAEVIASVDAYRGRKKTEDAEAAVTIDDVASGKAKMPSVPGKEIDTLMLSSPHIGEFAAEKAASGIKVENAVVVLRDADFMQKHWEEFCHLNAHLIQGQTPSIVAGLRMREASHVDRVDGFQSDKDGKIYMRPGKIGFRIALHEAVHKFGGQVFRRVLGDVLNEGATDYIAMLVCAQIGAEIATEYYPGEKKLLIELLGVLKISDAQLFDAYFRDNVEGILNDLVAAIGDEHAVLFRKAKTASEAAKVFNAGREAVNKKKASQKTAQKRAGHSPAQGVVQPMIVKMQSFGADWASTQAQESNLENLGRTKKDGVVDTLLNMGDNPLATIGAEETLYILGHGTGDTIDGKNAAEVLAKLEEFGYSNAHRGLIDLVSCSSAGFLKGFQTVLTQKGYTNAIKGYAGLVHINREGKTEVVPQSMTPTFLKVKNLSRELYGKERGALEEQLAKVKGDEAATQKVNQKIAKLERDYNSIVDNLNRLFEPGEEHEVFSTTEAWKKHGTPTSIAEWIEMSK